VIEQLGLARLTDSKSLTAEHTPFGSEVESRRCYRETVLDRCPAQSARRCNRRLSLEFLEANDVRLGSLKARCQIMQTLVDVKRSDLQRPALAKTIFSATEWDTASALLLVFNGQESESPCNLCWLAVRSAVACSSAALTVSVLR